MEEMHHEKFMKYYIMSYLTFNNLIHILSPFLKSECVNQVRPLLEVKKIVAYVIYRFAHCHSPNHMVDCFKVRASIIKKHVWIICDILTNKKRLFSHCISIPMGDHLQRIIRKFEQLTCLPNVFGAIDGTHISSTKHASKRVTLAPSNFYNKKISFHCFARNICVGQPSGVYDGDQYKVLSLYRDLRNQDILQELLIVVESMRCTLYSIANSVYPIHTYLMKN